MSRLFTLWLLIVFGITAAILIDERFASGVYTRCLDISVISIPTAAVITGAVKAEKTAALSAVTASKIAVCTFGALGGRVVPPAGGLVCRATVRLAVSGPFGPCYVR
jgi:hypothetical protein